MGVTSGFETMDAEEVTLAEVLGDAGYETALFGKWPLGEHRSTAASSW
jgi:arylsulfatase A-like enzyme